MTNCMSFRVINCIREPANIHVAGMQSLEIWCSTQCKPTHVNS
nr:MAG TPA: Heat stable enterotoxin [Crassvirales sp.]